MEGQVIAGYRIVQTIGAGGMGIVYEGVHQHLGRRVAIKLLHDRYSHDRDSLSRFYNEARAASLAQHPCVIDVHEFGFTAQGQAYIVMEFLQGCSLEKRLREIGGRMGTPCLPLAQKLAAGLSFLHERGIVHRDRSQISISHLRCTARTSQRRRDTDAAPHRSHSSPYSYIL